jgi:hypothetical protein
MMAGIHRKMMENSQKSADSWKQRKNVQNWRKTKAPLSPL